MAIQHQHLIQNCALPFAGRVRLGVRMTLGTMGFLISLLMALP